MLNGESIAQIKQFADEAMIKAGQLNGMYGAIEKFILQHFGQNGLYAAYIAVAALLLLIITRLAKMAFSTLKYLVIPSVALAFAGSFFIPYSFVALLPVTVTLCSLFLLFKG